MLKRIHSFRYALAVLMVLSSPCPALFVRGWSEGDQVPYVWVWGVPAEPELNGSFPPGAANFLGVGWPDKEDTPDWTRQMALVTPQHFVTATHYAIATGTRLVFINKDNQLVSRAITALTVVKDTFGRETDLTLGKLDSPIDESTGIKPFPVLQLPKLKRYVGLPLRVFGVLSRMGTAKLAGFESAPLEERDNTVCCYFDFKFKGKGRTDCSFESGDSGAPSFVVYKRQLALIGTHSALLEMQKSNRNYDTFIPAYTSQLNALLLPDGYQLRLIGP